ncbi:MAG: SH3 domain-containing protein [Chitinophagaceae bacterium]|nr:SH3 domain-containing protein [Chitinophagaceae bacterium]
MKRITLLILSFLICLFSFSQQTYYAAAKAGLSLREQPSTNAKVLDKIPYGEKISVPTVDTFPPVAISTEGFNGFWWHVNYNGKSGFIVSSYVLPLPSPKAGTKTLKDYFTQVSSVIGDPLVIKKTDLSLNEMGESTLTKQFYKNGMEWHRWEGYESASELCLLPDLTIEQCFLLVRLIGQYPELISDKDIFPSKNSTIKNPTGDKTIEVEREKYDGKAGPVNKIKIISAQGAVTEFEIYLLDTQAVIFWSSGV